MVEDLIRLESTINKQQNEIVRLRDKYSVLFAKHSTLQTEHATLVKDYAEIKSNLNAKVADLAKKQEDYIALQTHSQHQQAVIDSHQRVVDWQGQISQQRTDLMLKERTEHRNVLAQLLASQTELEQIRIGKTILDHEHAVLAAKLSASERQNSQMTALHETRQAEFLEQIASMANTIEVLSKSLEQRQQEGGSSQNQGDFFDEDLTLPDINMDEEDNNNTDQDNFYERSEVKQLTAENEMLSKRLYDYENRFAKQVQESTGQIAVLNARLKELEEKARSQGDLVGEQKQPNTEEMIEVESEKLSALDIKELQNAYAEEVKCKSALQEKLNSIMSEMRVKNPILKRQSEKWNQMNVDFIALQEKLITNVTELEETKEVLTELNVSKEQLSGEVAFMKEEIIRLATQIQHLLKVNFKLKQSVSAQLGKPALDLMLDAIRADNANQVQLKDVDGLYDTNIAQVYTDIPEIVTANMNMVRKLLDLQQNQQQRRR